MSATDSGALSAVVSRVRHVLISCFAAGQCNAWLFWCYVAVSQHQSEPIRLMHTASNNLEDLPATHSRLSK
jgi:hypothetical protein